MAKTLTGFIPKRLLINPIKQPTSVHGGFASSRSFSSSGFPFLSLLSSSKQAKPSFAAAAAASCPLPHSDYASQFLAAAKGGKFAAPRSRAATAVAVDATPLPTFPCEKSAIDRAFQQMTANGRERAFFVNDVGVVERQYARWCKNLPNVRPFYAVKCNPDTTLLRALAGLGAGFDCASADEIAAALSMGVEPAEIIFANPIKSTKDLKYARSVGVKKMTFDNEAELYKVKEHHPEAELVLRLLADDSGSKMKFGVKFGAPSVQVEGLLKTAKALQLRVIGTSFHIGSGCMDASAYGKAIALSRSVFDLADALNMPKLTLLDLGGGYPGNPVEHQRNPDGTPAFEEMAAVIRDSLAAHFPADSGVEVIGEPGRYMATAWSTLFVMVQGKREAPRTEDDAGKPRRMLYYINDGVYGAFNCVMFDHAHPEPIPAYRFMADKQSLDRTRAAAVSPYLSPFPGGAQSVSSGVFASMLESAGASAMQSARAFHSTGGRDHNCVGTFFGPTCDSMDVVATDFPCEELFVGDWLAFAHAGAYTSAAATTFNGMPKATAHYCRSRQNSPDAN